MRYTTVRQQKQNSKTETESLGEERGIKNLFRCRYGPMQENCVSQNCPFHSLRAVLQCCLIENANILNAAHKLQHLLCVSSFGSILLFFWMCGISVLNCCHPGTLLYHPDTDFVVIHKCKSVVAFHLSGELVEASCDLH